MKHAEYKNTFCLSLAFLFAACCKYEHKSVNSQHWTEDDTNKQNSSAVTVHPVCDVHLATPLIFLCLCLLLLFLLFLKHLLLQLFLQNHPPSLFTPESKPASCLQCWSSDFCVIWLVTCVFTCAWVQVITNWVRCLSADAQQETHTGSQFVMCLMWRSASGVLQKVWGRECAYSCADQGWRLAPRVSSFNNYYF